jgi:hypothetical protein
MAGCSRRASYLLHGTRPRRWHDDNGRDLRWRRSGGTRTSRDACFLFAGGGYSCDSRALRFWDYRSQSFLPTSRKLSLRRPAIFTRRGPGLRVHGRICGTVFRLSGVGRATAPLLVSLLRVAIVLAGGWMLQQQVAQLDWLYYLVAGSTVLGALTLGIVFAVRPPNRRVQLLSG